MAQQNKGPGGCKKTTLYKFLVPISEASRKWPNYAHTPFSWWVDFQPPNLARHLGCDAIDSTNDSTHCNASCDIKSYAPAACWLECPKHHHHHHNLQPRQQNQQSHDHQQMSTTAAATPTTIKAAATKTATARTNNKNNQTTKTMTEKKQHLWLTKVTYSSDKLEWSANNTTKTKRFIPITCSPRHPTAPHNHFAERVHREAWNGCWTSPEILRCWLVGSGTIGINNDSW